MQPTSSTTLALLAVAALACAGASPGAIAQPAPTAAPQHPIPQSLRYERTENMERLGILTHRSGAVGIAARRVIVAAKLHGEQEEGFIFPPLTLLPALADGKVTPDMAWALAMTDRVKAEREEIFQARAKITDALNVLHEAAERAHDKVAAEFAEAAIANTFADAEVLEPTVLLIGEYLHDKLPAAH
jgi:hypothetical protein